MSITVVLVVEVYREMGMKFEEAFAELEERIADPVAKKPRVPRPADEAAGLAMLQAVMKQSDFKGATG